MRLNAAQRVVQEAIEARMQMQPDWNDFFKQHIAAGTRQVMDVAIQTVRNNGRMPMNGNLASVIGQATTTTIDQLAMREDVEPSMLYGPIAKQITRLRAIYEVEAVPHAKRVRASQRDGAARE